MTIQATESEPINIKDLMLSEPQVTEGLPFDPKNEISEEEWQGIITHIEELKVFDDLHNNWKMFLIMAGDVKLIDPTRVSTLELDEEQWQRIYAELKALEERDSIQMNPSLPKELSSLRIFSPARAAQYPVNPKYKSWLKESLTKRRPYPTTYTDLADAAVAFPELIDYSFSPRDIRLKRNYVNRTLELYQQVPTESTLDESLKRMVELKILFPDQVGDWNLVPPWFWDLAKKQLDIYRKRDFKDFPILDLATQLTILAAGKVEISEDFGMRLVMASDSKIATSEPAMPDIRKF